MEIIDGQNRFAALKDRKLPIQYIVAEGYDIKQVRVLNADSKVWSLLDYIRSYAESGNIHFVKLLAFCEKYKVLVIATTTALAMGAKDNKQFKKIHRGTFEFKDEDFCYRVADSVLLFEKVDINDYKVYKRRNFALALRKAMLHPAFDVQRLLEKVKLQPRQFVPCVTVTQYATMLEDLYNYRCKGAKIHFD